MLLPRAGATAARRRPLGGVAACRRHATSAAPPPTPPAGLCGVPWLRQPADFMTAARAAVDVCNALVGLVERSAAAAAAAATDPTPHHRPGPATLRQLDAISDSLCKVLDVGEFVRTNHASDGWRDAAEETYRALGSYMHTLNTHTPLHAALVAITSDGAAMGALSPEQRRMAVLLQREFEREGIHLDDGQRAELVRLNDAVHEASAGFQAGARDCSGAFAHGAGGGALARAVQAYLATCGNSASGSGSAAEAAGAEAALNAAASRSGFVPAVLQHVADPGVRRQALVGREGECAPNLPALAALGATRQELATRIGFPSYAHMVLADRMAGTPENVGAFLTNLRASVAPTLARDLAALSDAKCALFGAAAAGADPGAAVGSEAVARARRAVAAGDLARAGASGNSSSLPIRTHDDVADNLRALAEAPVYPWDVPLLQAALTAASSSAADGAASGSADDDGSLLAAAYRRYATVGAVLRGLQGIVRRAFGVEMVREPVRAGEAWDLAASSTVAGGAAGWARHGAPGGDAAPSSLFKYRLVHESEGDLGVIYLDLFARPGKYAGAAHYVIRCGKALHEYDGAFEASLLGKGATAASATGGSGGSVQLPIVALVTNFAPPPRAASAHGGSSSLLASLMGGRAARGSSSASGGSSGSPAGTADEERVGLLPREVETLYHEFGHALHSMLSRTQFQHLHGTRAALDFVELPSHTFEYFCRDYRVVAGWAVDPATGDAMPRALFDAVAASRTAFRSLDLQTNLTHAAFDLCFYGPPAAAGIPPADVPLLVARHGGDRRTEWFDALLAAQTSATGGSGSGGHLAIPLASAEALLSAPPLLLRGAGGGGGGHSEPPEHTLWRGGASELLRAVTQRFSLLPPVPGSAWPGGFTHLVTYAAGYYSYLYAQAFSAAVWRALFAADPLSRAAGERYRRQLLAPGAGADPAGLIAATLGGPPTLAALVDELRTGSSLQQAQH